MAQAASDPDASKAFARASVKQTDQAARLQERSERLREQLFVDQARGPVCRTLRKLKLLRDPDLQQNRSPPDFRRIFRPHPWRPRVDLGDALSLFWDDVVMRVICSLPVPDPDGGIDSDDGEDEVTPGRLPLLYLMSSFGRGKTLFLREAAQYLHTAGDHDKTTRASRIVHGRHVVVLCVNFNGDFRVQTQEKAGLESRSDEFRSNFYLLLHVRILFNELAKMNDPAENFTLFLQHFYADYKLGRFSFSDVYAETRRLMVARANRGTRRDVVVLLVDEIAKLRTGVAGDLSEVLGLDISSCIRSECCALSVAGSGLGLTCCTAMESSHMLAERSASGRPAEALNRIPPGSLLAQTLRLRDAMRLSAGEDSGFNWQRTGAWRDAVRPELDHMAVALALMGGVVWRCAELLAIELRRNSRAPVQAMLDRVERQLLVDSTGKDLGFTSLWAKENAAVRDQVLAASFLAEDVSEGSLVVDVEDRDELPVKNKDNADPSDPGQSELMRKEVLVRRAEVATEIWKQFKNPGLDRLTWGNAVSLGILTCGRATKFTPAMIPLVLLHALHDNVESSPSGLWSALRALTRSASVSAEGEKDSEGNNLRAAVKYDWCGWELFLLRWEHLISCARALRPAGWRSITIGALYGRPPQSPCFQGPSPLLHKVLVDATVARSGVVFLAGAGEQEQDASAITLNDLLAGHVKEDEMLRTVYKLRNGAASVDGVCFYRALNYVPGVATRGELVAVFIQGKHSIPTAATSFGKKDVEDSLSVLSLIYGDADQQATTLFGNQTILAKWQRRSVFLFACMRKVSPMTRELAGPWAAQTLVLGERDLERLLGVTLFYLARALYLLHPQGPTRSSKPQPPGTAAGA